jgi:hypothetical protein
MKLFTNKIHLITILLVLISKIGFAAGGTISTTKPSNGSICQALAIGGTAPAWTTLNPLVLNENANGNFAKNKLGTIILSAPTGWSFNTATTLTVTGMSADFISFTAVVTNSTTITLSWKTTNSTQSTSDVISIAGVQVQATSVNSANGPIYASGTSGTIPTTLVTGTQGIGLAFADLSLIHIADGGAYQTICSTTATMAGNDPAPGTGTWAFVSGPVTPIITTTTLYSTGITGITTNGAYTFKWTTITSCGTTTDNVVITKTITPVAAAGPDQTFCFPNSTNLAANFPSFGTGTWSILAGSPNTSTAQISDINDESATFLPTVSGTYTLRWTITLAGCATNTDDVVLTVSAGPNTSVAGPSQTICATNKAVMAANTASATCTGLWSVVSGPSLLATQFSIVTSPTSSFTPAGGAGIYVLAWTITKTLGGCTSVSNATVVVNPAPTVANAGPDQTVCTFANLAANTPAVGTGSWTVISGTGGGSFSSTTNPNGTFDPTNQSTAITIRWTISSAGCTSSFDDVIITATCIPTTTTALTAGTSTTGLTGCPSTIVFTDDGGPVGTYSASFTGVKTFTAPAGSCLSYSFSAFDMESCCEDFNIYDGPTTASTPSLNFTGSAIPPSGKSTGNSITFQFTSDASVQYNGWILYVSCANACSGVPSAGTAVASPTVRCSTYTTNLSVSGGSSSDCSITYQWQSAAAVGGPYSNIAGATAQTATASVASTTYYRCITKCGGVSTNTIASSVATASMQGGGCGCPVSITIPYTTTGQTTCGQGDDITSSNVNTVNGSSSYYTGEDVVYTFTPSTTGQITVDITSSGSYTGLMLYKGCPTAAGSSTIANAQDYNGNKSLCGSVTAGQAYYLIIDSYASPTCNPYDLTISAPTGTTAACNFAYTPATTTYSFESFAGTALPTTDDVLFNVAVNFGFPVCFDGLPYTGGYVASNAALVFDAVQCFPNIQTTTIAAGGVSTGYTISSPAPVNGTSIPRNAVLAPWHDINPGLGTGLMQYKTLGTAPNRRFIVSYENIPMYSCGTASASIYYSAQIKLFETTNTIEIHVRKKAVCPGWNNGQAVLGLHNFNGTVYIPPVNATAHNAVASPGPYNQWTMTNTAYKFTTACGSSGACSILLPIGLVKFYGERVDKINNLYWETASEENLLNYTVERSTDGINFVSIGNVVAKNSPSKYHFEDKNALLGVINYYRLVVHEKDGTESSTNIISIISSVDEVLTVSQLYPNPTSNNFMIGLESKQKGQATINVYDVFGKIVASSSHEIFGGVNQYTISTEHLSFGVYYVEVLNSFNEIISKQKLIKE